MRPGLRFIQAAFPIAILLNGCAGTARSPANAAHETAPCTRPSDPSLAEVLADDMRGFWSPTEAQITQAKAIAEPFIASRLRITAEEQRRRVVKAYGFTDDGKRVLHLEYFDPTVFPSEEVRGPMMGGFPAYFTISVDSERWVVIDHYASPR
jgi:hypothetical protein